MFNSKVFVIGTLFGLITHGTAMARSQQDDWMPLRKAAIQQREENKETISVRSQENQTRFTVGPSAAILGKSTGVGGNAEISFRVSSHDPLYFGFLFGYAHWNADAGVGDASAIQVLPSFIYHFERTKTSSVHPYMGFSSGLAFLKGSANTDLGLGAGSDSRTSFVFLFRPGLEFSGLIEPASIGVESKMGFIGSSFTFMPQLSLSFSL